MNYYDILLAKKLEDDRDPRVEGLSVTENGRYEEDGVVYKPVIVSVAPPEDSYQLKSITTPTSLATFEASEMPMPSLKVSVEAQQDLHGYDKPWPAGGGKNILPMGIINEEVNDIIYTKISDIDGNALGFSMVGLCSSTTSRIIASIPVKAGTYILNGCNGGAYNSYALRIRDENDTSNAVWQEDGDAQIAFASDTTALVQVFVWQNTNVNQTIYPMLRKSGTSADFEPYSNECPISGWDEANVSDVDDIDNPTVTQTTTITLPQTVYGAEVDVVNGVLRITKILYTKTNVSYYGLFGDDNAPLFYFSITDNIKPYGDATAESNNKLYSNYYNSISTINAVGMKDCEIRTQWATPPTRIYFRDDRFTDETSINTWLASNPLQVLCVLATPIIIPLTPTLIKSLDGTNNLSVDCGDVIEGEYFKAL